MCEIFERLRAAGFSNLKTCIYDYPGKCEQRGIKIRRNGILSETQENNCQAIRDVKGLPPLTDPGIPITRWIDQA